MVKEYNYNRQPQDVIDQNRELIKKKKEEYGITEKQMRDLIGQKTKLTSSAMTRPFEAIQEKMKKLDAVMAKKTPKKTPKEEVIIVNEVESEKQETQETMIIVTKDRDAINGIIGRFLK